MPDLTSLCIAAEQGCLASQRALLTYLGTVSYDPERDAEDVLDAAARYGRMACEQGGKDDMLRLVSVLMMRAALPNGEAAGGEAIALISRAADAGDEDAGASIQVIADQLPLEKLSMFFTEARHFGA